MSRAKPPAIGIDLGTTNCCVGVCENGEVTVIANDEGNRITPSYVAFTDIDRFIGEAAKKLGTTNPANTIYDALRLIGLKFEDPLVQASMKNWPFKVIRDKDGRPKISMGVKGARKSFSPEEICSMLFEKMKTTAENHLDDRTVTDAVVTVPAILNYSQRQVIRNAATTAGLNVLRILSAPVAAAIAHYLHFHDIPEADEDGTGEKNVLVFDLGGGTLDVSVLAIENGLFEVKSAAGNTQLGGEDIDIRMLWDFAQGLSKKHKREITRRKSAFVRLLNGCETAKKTLSESTFSEAFIDIDALFDDGTDFHGSMNQHILEAINYDLFRKSVEAVEKCLLDANMEKTQIEDVLLVGGSTRIPTIRQILKDFFNGKELKRIPNSEEAAAYGAAVYAAYISRDRNETIQDILIIDAVPVSLGVETTAGVMTTIIPKNTSIPKTVCQILKISTENQPVLMIKIYEGESEMTKHNDLLGTLEFPEILPARHGMSHVEVEITFCIGNVDGSMLKVWATEKFTGKENSISATFEKGCFRVKEIGQRNMNDKGAEGGKKSRKRKAEGKLKRRRFYGCDSGEPQPESTSTGQPMVTDLEMEQPEPEPLNNDAVIVTQDPLFVNKKILEEAISTDFAIVCGSGAEIKCHKAFLCAQSGILRAMIESDGAANTMIMNDTREESVKAFLAFLYQDTTEASKDSGIAFELLRVAHQCDIERLKIAMKEMILTKETSWFGVDDAVRLFACVRHWEDGESLKMKAIEVLKKNISSLEKSDCCKELFKKDPESALDLYM